MKENDKLLKRAGWGMGCNLARLSLISFQLLPVRCLKTPAPRQPACHYLSLGAVLGRGIECLGSLSCPRGSQASCITLQHWGSSLMSRALGTKGGQGTGRGPCSPRGLIGTESETQACALTGSGTDDISLCGMTPSQRSHTVRAIIELFFKMSLVGTHAPKHVLWNTHPKTYSMKKFEKQCVLQGMTYSSEPDTETSMEQLQKPVYS